MNGIRITVLIPVQAYTRSTLAARYDALFPSGDTLDERVAASPKQGVRAILTNGSTGLTAAHFAQFPDLEIVCSLGAGHENIDLAAARARGITVTHAPGSNDATVADHTLGLMLAVARGFVEIDPKVRAGGWNGMRGDRPTLNGSRLGLIGLGHIGVGIARRAAAFDMEVAYCTRTPRADVSWRHEASVLELARARDYLVAACPGGPATRHLVNAEVLAALGPEGFFINIARGSVVDTAALIAALQSGGIAGAGLDVYEGEPAIPAALLACPNTVFTPHRAGRSPASTRIQTQVFVDAVDAHFGGRAIAHRLV